MKARCMAYYFNNQRIKRAEFIKKIKDKMSLKLQGIQKLLMKNKFGNITTNKENKSTKFIFNDNNSSLDLINSNHPVPRFK